MNSGEDVIPRLFFMHFSNEIHLYICIFPETGNRRKIPMNFPANTRP